MQQDPFASALDLYASPLTYNMSLGGWDPARYCLVADVRDPRIAEGLRVALVGFDRRCTGDCEFVVLTIPTKEYAFSEAVAASRVEAPKSYRELVVAEEALWKTIGNALASRGSPTLALDPRGRKPVSRRQPCDRGLRRCAPESREPLHEP
jgi:hypothetical protein